MRTYSPDGSLLTQLSRTREAAVGGHSSLHGDLTSSEVIQQHRLPGMDEVTSQSPSSTQGQSLAAKVVSWGILATGQPCTPKGSSPSSQLSHGLGGT